MSILDIKDIFIYISAVTAFLIELEKRVDKANSKLITRLKTALVLIILVNATLTFCLSINKNKQITGTLKIELGSPLVVNYNGYQTDKYIVGADYNVITWKGMFSEYTEIELLNLSTLERSVYKTTTIYNGYLLDNIKSGKYTITIRCKGFPDLINTVALTSSNIEDNIWNLHLYYWDDFNCLAKELKIELDESELDNIVYPIFGIGCDACSVYLIFETEIINNSFKGKFLAIPKDTYVIYSGVTAGSFNPHEIYLE